MSSKKRKNKKRKDGQYNEHVKVYNKIHEKESKNIRNKEYRDYKEYEKKRREEGDVKKLKIKKLQKIIHENFPDPEKWVAKATCLIDLNFHNHSYRGHVAYLKEHVGSVNMYGLKKIPSKSGLHAWAKDLAGIINSVLKLLGLQAGSDACGTLLGDSSGFSIVKYKDWDDAKRGVISRREFNKLHILIVSHGMISVHAVTAGRRHDSPIFQKMYRIIPNGDGYVKLDAAYLARENCDVIAKSGRKPVICPKNNSCVKGFHPMGQMQVVSRRIQQSIS